MSLDVALICNNFSLPTFSINKLQRMYSYNFILGPNKKKIRVFQVSRPYLKIRSDPKDFFDFLKKKLISVHSASFRPSFSTRQSMSCKRSGEKSKRVKANDLICLFNAGVFVSMAYSGASVLNISKEKCVHGPAERQFNVVTQEVTFEKFECNYWCKINSMNSLFVAENANGLWTELSDSMYQMPKKKFPTYRI